jgi:hypothetical protein
VPDPWIQGSAHKLCQMMPFLIKKKISTRGMNEEEAYKIVDVITTHPDSLALQDRQDVVE